MGANGQGGLEAEGELKQNFLLTFVSPTLGCTYFVGLVNAFSLHIVEGTFVCY